MASSDSVRCLFLLFSVIALFRDSSASRKLNEVVQDQAQVLKYHNGPLLSGKFTVNLVWYGRFKPSQRAIVSDFIASLSASPSHSSEPSVSSWWKIITDKYYGTVKASSRPSLSLGKQIIDETCSLGKRLTNDDLVRLASRGDDRNTINVVLTSYDVFVDGFCSSECGGHGSSSSPGKVEANKSEFPYIWIGNSERQCPGECAWPFHQPFYGPQTLPLVAPNNDVGADGMVINLASLLAGTVTNPFKNGYFQDNSEAPLEAASACTGVYGPGVYGPGAYPGYAGDLLMDGTTGASFNAHGVNGRKYLLPALYDPTTSSCSTLL